MANQVPLKDCPCVYGTVFRWTLTSDYDESKGEHPDDSITCPECNGARVIPMEPSDFIEYGEPIPANVLAPTAN